MIMLNFKIGNIVSYIGESGIDLSRAAKEFFGTQTVSPHTPNLESVFSLFNEWLAEDIIAIGVPEHMIADNLSFFQNLWNFFPHKKLNGACPAERYHKAYG